MSERLWKLQLTYKDHVEAIPERLRWRIYAPFRALGWAGLCFGAIYSIVSIQKGGIGIYRYLMDLQGASDPGKTYSPSSLIAFAVVVACGWMFLCLMPPNIAIYVLVKLKVYPVETRSPVDSSMVVDSKSPRSVIASGNQENRDHRRNIIQPTPRSADSPGNRPESTSSSF